MNQSQPPVNTADASSTPVLTLEVGAAVISVDGAVRDYQSGLLRYAQHLTGSFAAASEAVQETFVRLLEETKKGTSYQSNRHLRAWLYRVCRQRVIDQQRKEARMKTSLESEDIPDHGATDPAEMISHQDAHDQVQAELSQLTANQQEVVRLKFQVGMSYREIANVTGLTVTNVGYLLHTAIATLKSKLA